MMSLNELMDAARGVTNMYLAHEIAVDKVNYSSYIKHSIYCSLLLRNREIETDFLLHEGQRGVHEGQKGVQVTNSCSMSYDLCRRGFVILSHDAI